MASSTPARLRRSATITCFGIALLGMPTFSFAQGARNPKDQCEVAVPEFLKRRAEGDLSARLLSDLAQALECSGRVEEALGATFMEIAPDTAGKMGLMLIRVQLLRELGLNDVARSTEEELGMALGAADSGPAPEPKIHWAWDTRPTISGSVAWIDQFDRPHSALLPLHYSSTFDAAAVSRQTGSAIYTSQPASDSILLEGGSIQVGSGLSWGGWSEKGGFTIGPSGSVALPDDSIGWRSATGGLDMNIILAPSPSLSFTASLAGSRTWFMAETGPVPTQDEFTTSLAPTWKIGNWSLGSIQSLRCLRTNSSAWGWTGNHSATIGWTIAPWLGVSLSGNGAWYSDPAPPSDLDWGYQVVIPRQNLAADSSLFRGEGPVLALLDSIAIETAIQFQTNSPETLSIPQSRNQSWKQFGFAAGLTLGPWHGLALNGSGSWSETRYSHQQTGYFVNPVWWYYDQLSELVVFRDTATGQDYVVKSISPHGSSTLVPAFWRLHRRDQCWTTQTTLTWKPKPWLNLRASWAWTRNVSNLEDYVDGASYVRNVVSLSSSVSW